MKRKWDGLDWTIAISILLLLQSLVFTFQFTKSEIEQCRMTNPMNLLPVDCASKKTPKAEKATSAESGSVAPATTDGKELLPLE